MAWIDDSIFQYKGNDLVVMLYLITHMNDKGECEVSYAILSHDTDLSVRSIRTVFDRLKTTGKIICTPTKVNTLVMVCNYERYVCIQQQERQRSNADNTVEEKIAELTAHINEIEEKLNKKKRSHDIKPVSQEDKEKGLQERAYAFGQTLIPYLIESGGSYTKEMIRAFYNYWTEPNKSRTKMRFEQQQTWEVGRRLETWANNNRNHNNYQNRNDQRTDDVQRRQEGAAAIIARLAAEEGNDA